MACSFPTRCVAFPWPPVLGSECFPGGATGGAQVWSPAAARFARFVRGFLVGRRKGGRRVVQRGSCFWIPSFDLTVALLAPSAPAAARQPGETAVAFAARMAQVADWGVSPETFTGQPPKGIKWKSPRLWWLALKDANNRTAHEVSLNGHFSNTVRQTFRNHVARTFQQLRIVHVGNLGLVALTVHVHAATLSSPPGG